MPYDRDLDDRIRAVTARWGEMGHKKMFGGVCHLLRGNMFCGVHEDRLILRLGEEAAREALQAPNVRPFDMTGKPMRGWVMVEPAGTETDDELRAWLRKARDFAETLPAK